MEIPDKLRRCFKRIRVKYLPYKKQYSAYVTFNGMDMYEPAASREEAHRKLVDKMLDWINHSKLAVVE
jgi:hypothetical protein